jgi:hypothetical protein
MMKITFAKIKNNKVFYIEDNQLKVISFEKQQNGNYTYKEEASYVLDFCSGTPFIEDVKGPFIAINCIENNSQIEGSISLWKYEPESLLAVGNKYLYGRKITIGDGGFIVEKGDYNNSTYEVYKFLFGDEASTNGGLDFEKVAEYPAPDCSRLPRLFFEDGVGICVSEEQGFLMFDLYTGKEVYKYLYLGDGNNIWEVVPFEIDGKPYIAIGGWIDNLNSDGVEWFRVNIPEENGTTGSGEEEPSETESGTGSENATVIHLNAGWNLKGSSEGIGLSELKDIGGLRIVWTYRDGEWYFWSPDDNLVNHAHQLGFPIIDSLKPYEGFWLKVDNDVDVTIKK